MRLPFQILHIHKGKSIEAYHVINENKQLRIATLCPVHDGFVVTSNLELSTADSAFKFTTFTAAYAEYYRRITDFLMEFHLQEKTDANAPESLPLT